MKLHDRKKTRRVDTEPASDEEIEDLIKTLDYLERFDVVLPSFSSLVNRIKQEQQGK